MKIKNVLIAIICLFSLSLTAQTKTWENSKIKVQVIPESIVIDSLLSRDIDGVVNQVKYTSLFAKLLVDLQNAGIGGTGTGLDWTLPSQGIIDPTNYEHIIDAPADGQFYYRRNNLWGSTLSFTQIERDNIITNNSKISFTDAPVDALGYIRSASGWVGSDVWVVDDLLSLNADLALSANQGRILNEIKSYIDRPIINTGLNLNINSANKGAYVNSTSTTPTTFTVPLQSTTPLEIGTQMYVNQGSSGTITMVSEGAVLINSPGGLVTSTLNRTGFLIKKDVDEWDFILLGANGTGSSDGNDFTTSGAIVGTDLVLQVSNQAPVTVDMSSISGGDDILPLSNIFTGASNTFSNEVRVNGELKLGLVANKAILYDEANNEIIGYDDTNGDVTINGGSMIVVDGSAVLPNLTISTIDNTTNKILITREYLEAKYSVKKAFVTGQVTSVDLNNQSGTFYYTPQTSTSFTATNVIEGGEAYVIVDTSLMVDYPTLNGQAPTIQSPDFVAGEHTMTIYSNDGVTVEHFFTRN